MGFAFKNIDKSVQLLSLHREMLSFIIGASQQIV
jgi:hypothetical protein